MEPILLAAVLLVGAPASQSKLTLIDMAKANAGKVIQIVNVEQPPLRLEEMRDLADLVLHARVVSEEPLLSEDKMWVMTEYVLEPIRVLSAKPARLTMKPATEEVRVRRAGGTVEVDGLELTLETDISPPDAAMGAGAEAVFFLRHSWEGPYFTVVGGPYGIYRVNNGRVDSMTKGVAGIRSDRGATITSLADLIAIVKRSPKK